MGWDVDFGNIVPLSYNLCMNYTVVKFCEVRSFVKVREGVR
jgi:hypothetical protein